MIRLATVDAGALARQLERYGLGMQLLPEGAVIPGSYWGESEAGLQGDTLFARPDTPLHSVLHESAHYICMSEERRARLDRNAGGDDAEESAVCYLQVLLAEALPGVSRAAMFADMDEWGYSFRLGSTAAWFAQDAEDALGWLAHAGIIDARGALTGRRRA
ncbi:MAG TPA: hypothetical protein VN660_09945 [Steroidobacteraceae bacterium]|nr:hypothetical protein [Steroidobacteraceae bacterium]